MNLEYDQLEFTHNVRSEENIKFDKVIFLDVDGVLNTESYSNPIIHEDRIKRLKNIVDETQAKIVMSSSWKHRYKYFIKDPNLIKSESDKKDMQFLKDLLDKYNLTIMDYTQSFGTGPDARPGEIRAWLVDKPNVKTFVILDDDDFWKWNWLESYFVMTKRTINKYDKIRGLEDDNVIQAIKILNQKN